MSIATLTYSFTDNTTPVDPPAPSGDPLDATTLNAIIAKINAIIAAGNAFAGTIIAFGGASAPAGFLACDGSAISRTTYADLFTAIGTTWGVGDGSTTFNLPDLRGAFLRGTSTHGTNTMADGNAFAGPLVGSFENDQMQGHYHQAAAAQASGGASIWSPEYWSASRSDTLSDVTEQLVQEPTNDGTNGAPRSGDETRPFNAGILYCIKY